MSKKLAKLKKVVSLIMSLILSFLVIEMVILMTSAKIFSINKNIIAPFYGAEFQGFKYVSMLIISLLAFVWMVKRKFVQKRKYIFGLGFALSTSLYFFTQTPYYQYYNMMGNKIASFLGTDQSINNKMIASSKRYLGTNYKDAISIFKNKSIDDLKYSEIPYLAMAHEATGDPSHLEISTSLWANFYEYSKVNFPDNFELIYKENYIKSLKEFNKEYALTTFKNKDLENIIKDSLVKINKKRHGINTEKDEKEAIESYQELKKLGFDFVDFFLHEQKIEKRKISDFSFH